MLSVGEKIKQIRKAKGLSMENLAAAINKSQPYISRLERGDAECNPETLDAIKKFLGIENAPLLLYELELYRDRILACYRLQNAERYADAKTFLKGELSGITSLPFEHSLQTMYLSLETTTLLHEGRNGGFNDNIEIAEETITKADAFVGNSCKEAQFMYYRTKSRVHQWKRELELRLKYLNKARDTDCSLINDYIFYTEFAMSYYNIGKLGKAITYCELAKSQEQGNYVDSMGASLNVITCSCYLHAGEYEKAKKLLEVQIAQAKSIDDKYRYATGLMLMGLAHQWQKQYKESIMYFEQAFQVGFNPLLPVCLAFSADSLRHMKEHDKCRDVLAKARKFVDGDIDAHIEAVDCLLTLEDSGSINKLERKLIPGARDSGVIGRGYALYLCNELEAHYKKKRTKTKANAIAAIARDIYRDMYEGDIEL